MPLMFEEGDVKLRSKVGTFLDGDFSFATFNSNIGSGSIIYLAFASSNYFIASSFA